MRLVPPLPPAISISAIVAPSKRLERPVIDDHDILKKSLLDDPHSREPRKQNDGKQGRRSIRDWTEEERETRGFELLAAALKQVDGANLGDYRAIHRIGADSIDDLRRFFELKAYTGAMPEEVRLEPSEFQRAARAETDYFLAVVAGLERGAKTTIKIFAHPLKNLEWRRSSALKLGGVRDRRGL